MTAVATLIRTTISRLLVTHRLSYEPYSGRNRATLLRPFFHLYETCFNMAFLDQRVVRTCANNIQLHMPPGSRKPSPA